ncbi:hypothetical protein StoSoilA2_41700 [Arthrobacter sp. StoSoilA2]|nr:hypothetical protein StoSoilA2_41700 [Arthrobacter sp. StoSoilA2]
MGTVSAEIAAWAARSRSAARAAARVVGAAVWGLEAEAGIEAVAGSGVAPAKPASASGVLVEDPLGWARRRPVGWVRSRAIWARRG